jgi:L-asparaginase II
MRAEIASAARVDADSLPTSVDGCGVLTFALPLERAAAMFGRLPELEGGARVTAAMRAHPELLLGVVAADTSLMASVPGWIAKGGAEGLLCACSADGLGLALKVEDGAFRAILPALAEVLRRVGVDPGDLGTVAIESSQGEVVGRVATASGPVSPVSK